MSQSVHKTKKAVIQIEGILLNHKELGSLAREFLQKEVAVKKKGGGFPCGAVAKNPPANAGDTGSSPGPGGYHTPRSN